MDELGEHLFGFWRYCPQGASLNAVATLQHLTVERYDELVNVGVFDGQRVELVDGQLVEMSPQSPEHGSLIQWLTERFAARAELLRVQLPLAVPNGRPEPDLALARRRAHQHPDSALLVVEIAISSLDEDYAKLPGYAAANIPLAWIIDVSGRVVHVFEHPAGGRYRTDRTLRAGQTLPSPADGIAPILVGDLFAALDD